MLRAEGAVRGRKPGLSHTARSWTSHTARNASVTRKNLACYSVSSQTGKAVHAALWLRPIDKRSGRGGDVSECFGPTAVESAQVSGLFEVFVLEVVLPPELTTPMPAARRRQVFAERVFDAP